MGRTQMWFGSVGGSESTLVRVLGSESGFGVALFLVCGDDQLPVVTDLLVRCWFRGAYCLWIVYYMYRGSRIGSLGE